MTILRLHTSGNNTLVDWQNSSKINSAQIKTIVDTNGASPSKEITSIPSPFARIDLVLTAFEEVLKLGLDGNTIYHKMVSDSLDVGEIFFNMQRLSNDFEIIHWDKQQHINELKDSPNAEHKLVGGTLDMFIQQDGVTYNFNKLQGIYLLRYKGEGFKTPMDIVGATSPCTLFFSTANDLSYISQYVSFGNDQPFDGQYAPLYKRDFEYVKYLWAFKMNYPNFANDFSAVDAYLQATFSKLTTAEKNILAAINNNTISTYQAIQINGATQVEILGSPLHQINLNGNVTSDFEIKSTYSISGKVPLVLPIEKKGNKYTSLKYVTANWTSTAVAPISDTNALNNRTLPIVNNAYPYLTISDFLSDTIVKMPFDLDATHYFNGNIANVEGRSYLLPLTEQFFEYFTVDDLQRQDANGANMIELSENAVGISVVLRIPIKGAGVVNYIEYKRSYVKNYLKSGNSDNTGTIIEKEFGLGVFPFIKFNKGVAPHYRIPLFDKGKSDVKLSFYYQNNKINLKPTDIVNRRKKEGRLNSVETYVLGYDFDRIEISIADSINESCGNNAKAYVIPKLKKSGGTSQFTFAIDFGTSNTHIEYSKDGSPANTFDINSGDQQMIRLHKDYNDHVINDGFVRNNTPEQIGLQAEYKFPVRTALEESKNINYQTSVHTLASGNLAFMYEKDELPAYNKINTDLKWGVNNDAQIKLYLENILILIRNKVLLNGGDLAATKVLWLYPASMTTNHYNRFNKIWTDLYQTYIGNNSGNLLSMTESVAPCNFCESNRGTLGNVVTIDVGGGTTDVYVLENHSAKILSSFRFAANSMFGDALGVNSDNNGFVKKYLGYFKEILSKNDLNNLKNALVSIEKTKNSSDIISFLFSLNDNKDVVSKNISSLNFLAELDKNEQLKYEFIIFYSAIIYYVARLMKAKGLKKPLNIAFSGNGARTINLLSSDSKTISNYFKLIIEKVFEEEYSSKEKLQLLIEANPKLATCKGGIINPQSQTPADISDIKYSLLGIDATTIIDREKTYSDDSEISSIEDQVVDEVEYFIDFIFRLNNDKKIFTDWFGADEAILSFVKDESKRNLKQYAQNGIKKYKDEQVNGDGNIAINETLFFLPIAGMLNNIAREIVNQ